MSDDAAAMDAFAHDKERTERLTLLLVHLIGHRRCVGYVVALTDDLTRSITCLRCGRTSFNANDIDNKYCGHCHVFHAEVRP